MGKRRGSRSSTPWRIWCCFTLAIVVLVFTHFRSASLHVQDADDDPQQVLRSYTDVFKAGSVQRRLQTPTSNASVSVQMSSETIVRTDFALEAAIAQGAVQRRVATGTESTSPQRPLIPTKEENGVIVLASANFDEMIAAHKIIVVLFYAPWCPHCRNFMPVYNGAAKTLKGTDPSVPLGKVDAPANPALGQRFAIAGFPTLMLFRNGEQLPFATCGKQPIRTEPAIVAFALKKARQPTPVSEATCAGFDVSSGDVPGNDIRHTDVSSQTECCSVCAGEFAFFAPFLDE